MINFTDGEQEILKISRCTKMMRDIRDVETVSRWYLVVSVANIALSITALLGNALILGALYKETSLHRPSKALLTSLASTDFLVGLVAEPLLAVRLMSVVNKRWELCLFTRSSAHLISAVLCGVSLMTMIAISVDRLLALSLRLRYRQVVTVKRVRFAVGCFWLASLSGSLLYLWNKRIFFVACVVVILLAIAISTSCYIKVYLSLSHQQAQVRDQQMGSVHLNMARYKKTVTSALWVHSTLVVCYLPFVVVSMSTRISLSLSVAEVCTTSLIFLNSSLNPFLYCWKIREIRHEVHEIFKINFYPSAWS